MPLFSLNNTIINIMDEAIMKIKISNLERNDMQLSSWPVITR